MKIKFFSLCYHVLREERKAFFRYRPGLLWSKLENNAQEESGYLRPGLVSVSDALVLGVLTFDCRIPVNSKKQREESPKSWCTINSEEGDRKDVVSSPDLAPLTCVLCSALAPPYTRDTYLT